MSKWTILEWDLRHPIIEKIGPAGLRKLKLDAVGANLRRVLGMPPVTSPGAFVPIRVEIDFQGAGMKSEDEFAIVEDPLLQQRIVDAVREPFEEAAQQIAGELMSWDRQMGPMPGEATHLQNMKAAIERAKQIAPTKVGPLMTQLEQEKKGASEYRWSLRVNLILGVISVGLGIATLAAPGGAAVVALAVPAALATGRGGLDLLKSFRDALTSAAKLERRLEGGMVYMRDVATTKGWQGVKAVLGGTIKLPSVGYTMFGSPFWASVADLKDDCELYEKKLMEIRDTVHGLAREVPKLLDKIGAEKGAAREREREFKWRGKEFASQSQTMTLKRTAKEAKLHELLEKIIEFEKGWRFSSYRKGKKEWNWQARLDGIKSFKGQLDQALDQRGVQNFEAWEKNLDLCVNAFLAGFSAVSGGAQMALGESSVLESVATVVGGVCDAYGIKEQVTTEGSAKFEV